MTPSDHKPDRGADDVVECEECRVRVVVSLPDVMRTNVWPECHCCCAASRSGGSCRGTGCGVVMRLLSPDEVDARRRRR